MASPALSVDQIASVERGKVLALNLEVHRARMRGDAHSIIALAGFEAFMAGWQRDLISIAEAARAAGFDLKGWVASTQPETPSTSNPGSC